MFMQTLYVNVYNNFIHNYQKLETTQMSSNNWRDKTRVDTSLRRIRLSNKSEQSTNLSNNMDKY